MPVRNTPPGTAFLVGDGLKYRAPCPRTHAKTMEPDRLSGEKERNRPLSGGGLPGTKTRRKRAIGTGSTLDTNDRCREREKYYGRGWVPASFPGIIFHPPDPSSVKENLDRNTAFLFATRTHGTV